MTLQTAAHPTDQDVEPRLLITVEEAARRLTIGRTMMFALVHDGCIESVRIGRLRRIPVDALAAFVDSTRQTQSPSSQL